MRTPDVGSGLIAMKRRRHRRNDAVAAGFRGNTASLFGCRAGPRVRAALARGNGTDASSGPTCSTPAEKRFPDAVGTSATTSEECPCAKVDAGGATVRKSCPLDSFPLFVRAGSIVPMGPDLPYATEKPDAPYKIRIYPGVDAAFRGESVAVKFTP